MSLREVIDSHRIVVTVGSGGVGKTTSAAAIAVYAAMQGRRVLCLTIDPARRLANSLGLAQMTTSEQVVPKELFAAQGLAVTGTLYAMMLDTKRTFDALITEQARSEESKKRILSNHIYKYVSNSLAGTQEYMAMEKLHKVKQDPQWDLIVLDTPPTQNALDFLDAPERLVGAIDSPATRWFVQAFNSESKGAFNFLGKAAGLVFKGLAQFTGAEFLDQVAEFIAGLNEMFGGFKARAEMVSRELRSSEVAFVVVTSPSPLAVREARFFSDRLKQAGMRQNAVVMNQVHSRYEGSVDVAALAELLQKSGHEGSATDLAERISRALEAEEARGKADRREADALRAHVGEGVTFVEVPAFEADVHDLGALARVATYLTGAKFGAVTV
jgi:anion-transporting  ArsA/GET3 family ATPase